ncbi:MAG TPA: mycothiol system anti-sigma-R factor [Acidobacteria bacterium]|nr:mycothiol system anti-sigma-R factor [Acidobacteriota bacterium]
MDCKEVGTVLFLFFDNEMEDDLLSPFRDHVARCSHCAQRLAYTRRLLLIVRERCARCCAPERLRMRILTSLPHRGSLPGTH